MTLLAAALRAIAIAIAALAVLDPAWERSTEGREPLTIVATSEDALSVASRVGDDLRNANATVVVHSSQTAAAACPSSGACVLVSDGAVPERVTAGARLVAVVAADGRRDSGGPAITSVEAPAHVHRDVASTLRVQTDAPALRIDVFDGITIVGSASPQGQTTVDVPWVPVDGGARHLRVVADGNRADVGVTVEAEPTIVLFYEPQATWLGTFVRRTLEDDSRFAVRGRVRIAPPVAVTRGEGAALNAEALRDTRVVFVTAPELLSARDAEMLATFVAERGGSLIVLTDQRPQGPLLRLLPAVRSQGRAEEPRQAGILRASEWLTFAPAPGISTLAAIDDQPVIVSRSVGRGRVVVSGALDAWRYRQAADEFDRFWTTLTWDMARAAGPLLRLDLDRVVARPGEPVHVWTDQIDPDVSRSLSVVGSVECGDERRFLRLWPGARPGTFHGTLRIEKAGDCQVTVSTGEHSSTAAVTIRDDFRPFTGEDAVSRHLAAIAAAHGALFAAADGSQVGHVGPAIDERLERRATTVTTRPMRSPLWLLPFVMCLGGEWWLRRRSGLS